MYRFKQVFVSVIISCFFLVSNSAFAQKDTSTTQAAYPVVFNNDTLFFISKRVASFTPQQRAELIQQKIRRVSTDPYFKKDSLLLVEDELSSDIVYRDVIVHSVFNLDVPDTTLTRTKVAQERLLVIRNSIENFNSTHRYKIISLKILIAAAIILLLVFIIWLIKRLSSPLLDWFLNRYQSRFKDFYIGGYKLISASNFVHYIAGAYKIFKIIFTVILVYAALPFLFKLFPSTESIAVYMWDLVWNPLVNVIKDIVDYIPNLFAVVVISFLFNYLLKLFKYFVGEIEKGKLKIKGFFPEWANPTFSLVKFLILIFYLIVIYPFLPGSDSKIFQGVTVFVGLLVSIGSSSAIANIVAGLVITYMRPFKINSYVKIGDVTGTVIEKNLLVTRIMTIKNEEITIPNATVLSSYSLNYGNDGSGKLLIVHTTVTIGYNAPWQQVHELLVNAALSTQYVVADPKPFVFQTALGDFYVSYQVNAYTDMPAQQVNILSDLHQNIQDKFNEAGVEIMSAHYSYLRDGNQTTIPENYLDEKYKAPRFNVNVEGTEKKENNKQLKLNL